MSILRTGDRRNIFPDIVFLPFGHSFARKLRYFYDDAKEKSIADSLYSTVHRFQMNPFSDKHSETRFCRVDINVKGKKKIREKKNLRKPRKYSSFLHAHTNEISLPNKPYNPPPSNATDPALSFHTNSLLPHPTRYTIPLPYSILSSLSTSPSLAIYLSIYLSN